MEKIMIIIAKINIHYDRNSLVERIDGFHVI